MAEEEVTKSIEETLCNICLSYVPNEEMFNLKRCGCSFCRQCLSQFAQLHINEKSIQRLRCPGTHSFSSPLSRDEVKCLVSRDSFLGFVRLLHENAILKDPSRLFCPMRDCGAVCYSTGRLGARPIRCMTCGYKFCRLCHNSWPGRNHTCPEDLPISSYLKPIIQIQPALDPKDIDLPVEKPSTSTAAEVESFPEVPVTPVEDEVEVKRCPKCGVPIQRRAGCAQMKCARCGHSFCWFCLASLDHDYFLHHFESGPCRAALGHPRAAVYLYRLNAVCVICGLSTLALLCAPLAILCAPCIVLCAPRLPQCLFPNEGSEQLTALSTLENEELVEDTDSEADAEEVLVA